MDASADGMFSGCACTAWAICPLCMRLVFAVAAMVFGGLIAANPKKTIELQSALYRPFNWKLEPIDMAKEIRNTRIMGLAVLALGFVALFCAVLRCR